MLALSAVGSVVAGYVLARSSLLVDRAWMHDAASGTILQFVGTFGVWMLAEHAGLSAIITIVVYAMTLARLGPAAHRGAQPRQLLFGLGDRGLRPERARLRADGPCRCDRFSTACASKAAPTRFSWPRGARDGDRRALWLGCSSVGADRAGASVAAAPARANCRPQ